MSEISNGDSVHSPKVSHYKKNGKLYERSDVIRKSILRDMKSCFNTQIGIMKDGIVDPYDAFIEYSSHFESLALSKVPSSKYLLVLFIQLNEYIEDKAFRDKISRLSKGLLTLTKAKLI